MAKKEEKKQEPAKTNKQVNKKTAAKKEDKEIVIKEEDIIHIELGEKVNSKNTTSKNNKKTKTKTKAKTKKQAQTKSKTITKNNSGDNIITKKAVEKKTTDKNKENENKKEVNTVKKSNKTAKNKVIKKAKSRINKKRILIIIIQILLVVIMIFSAVKIYLWLKENKKSSELLENTQDSIVVVESNNNDDKQKKRYQIDFQKLKEKNDDTVAWIKVEGTSIELPVVKSDDNSYYLDRSFDKNYNSAGWPFMDYHNKADGTDKNMIIYGHNRKDGSMFGSLSNILNEEWQNNEENKYITLITENENAIYEVFSVYKIEDEDYYIKTSFITGEFGEFIQRLKNRSYKEFENTVSSDDKILTLSTCDNNHDYRVVLHAKKISEEEYMSK